MPGGDKKGPLGEGPMTGRQMGVCGSRKNQVFQNDETFYGNGHGMGGGRNLGHGRGNRTGSSMGRGRGNGRGRGFGRGN